MIWDTLATKKGIADSRLREAKENLELIKDELRKGVSVDIARTIIKSVWGDTSDARKLLARLVVTFPKENCNTILYAALPPYAIANILGDLQSVVSYVVEAQEYIERTTGVVLARLNGFDINDPVGLEAVNEFRRNVFTYIEGVKYNSFEIWVNEAAVTPSWKDYMVESESINDGDYLMLAEFGTELRVAHDRMMERRNKDIVYEGDYISLSGVTYQADAYLAEVNVTQMFAEYLNDLVTKLEIVLEM